MSNQETHRHQLRLGRGETPHHKPDPELGDEPFWPELMGLPLRVKETESWIQGT